MVSKYQIKKIKLNNLKLYNLKCVTKKIIMLNNYPKKLKKHVSNNAKIHKNVI